MGRSKNEIEYVYTPGQHTAGLLAARKQLDGIVAHLEKRKADARRQRGMMMPLPRPIQRLGCELY
jgi:hypothetical protein